VKRYPEGKSEYTHVTDRPWVFRYVGTPHAWYMYKNKLCLEEYTELLEMHPFESEHAVISDQLGREYEVYYVSVDPDDPEPDTVVPMPIDCQYSYTGNNKHGFYVTVNLESAT
jgi:D-alanyl-D-alanine carboxypeptidase